MSASKPPKKPAFHMRDIRSVQYRTTNGLACETWGEGVAAAYTSSTYSVLSGAKNYCRNPYLVSGLHRFIENGLKMVWKAEFSAFNHLYQLAHGMKMMRRIRRIVRALFGASPLTPP